MVTKISREVERVWYPWVVGVFLVLAIGVCVGGALMLVESKRILALPRPTGPYGVGRVVYDWTDGARKETLNGVADNRELVVGIWYPTLESGQKKSSYYPQPWEKVLEKEEGAWRFLITHPYEHVVPWSSDDAPIATASKRFPVVVFQPGFGRTAFDYTTMIEDIASHGYIVAASTPTYSANLVVFDDGRVARATPAGSLPEDAGVFSDKMTRKTRELLKVWGGDVSFIISRLEDLDQDGRSFLYGKADLAKIAVAGHSFGGATAYQVCKTDERCHLVIDIDGTLFGDNRTNGRVPLVYLSADHSKDRGDARAGDDYTEAIPKGQTAPTSSMSIKGSAHFNFSDLGITSPRLKYFGFLGSIDGETCLLEANRYIQSALDAYLR